MILFALKISLNVCNWSHRRCRGLRPSCSIKNFLNRMSMVRLHGSPPGYLRERPEIFSPTGPHNSYSDALVLAVSCAPHFLFIYKFEAPYIWTDKRDYISYFNPQEMRTRTQLISLVELWRIYALGQKYRSLLERQSALSVAY